MENILEVTGVAKIALRPDTFIVHVQVASEGAQFDDVTAEVASKIDRLNGELDGAGLVREHVKTVNFGVHPVYEEPDSIQVAKGKQIGFRCEHGIVVEDVFTLEHLSAVIHAIIASGTDAHFDLSFAAKDVALHKSQLMEMAVTNAREQAETLADAAGVTLGSIKKMTYRENMPMGFQVANRMGSQMSEMTPNDIVMQESVDIVWEITN